MIVGSLVVQIVGMHGIGQQHQGEHILHSVWYPALLEGDPSRRHHHSGVVGVRACQTAWI